MHETPVTIDPHPDPADIRFLEDQLYAFNVERTGITDGGLVAHFARDEHEIMLAGIFGWTWDGCLEIRTLWVRADRRGQGLGTRLLMAAEREARARGCTLALLDTHSFQAPDFYRARGYQVYAQLTDYPRGHAKIFLKKHL